MTILGKVSTETKIKRDPGTETNPLFKKEYPMSIV